MSSERETASVRGDRARRGSGDEGNRAREKNGDEGGKAVGGEE